MNQSNTPTTQPETAAHSLAEIPTVSASRYLQQLCKHFAHKLPVSFDPLHGTIAYAIGTCTLDADAQTLRLQLASPDHASLGQLQDVVARHLVRFAFREELAITWQPA